MCFQSGLSARLAATSHRALTTAAVARWMTPFSGPSHRSWLSPVNRFHATHVVEQRLDG